MVFSIIRWTVQLHFILLEAIRFLGDNGEVVVPSRVLEVMMNDERTSDILKAMEVQQLTREHVASHLQKLRRFLYAKIRRMNKFARWHRQHHHICQGHVDIKRRQLVKAPPNSSPRRRRGVVPLSTTTTQQDESMVCSSSITHTNNSNNNNNNVSIIPRSFGDNNVVAAGNYFQTMASLNFGDNIISVAATPTIYPSPPIYNNVGRLGQHLTADFIYYNNQEQGFGETCQLQGINYDISGLLDLSCFDALNKGWNEEDWVWHQFVNFY